MEPKPFASLSAGLLARKGTARPAMRRPYVPGMTTPTLPVSVQDDLGWNDMGHDEDGDDTQMPSLAVVNGHEVATPVPSSAPVSQPEVVLQQQKLESQLSAETHSQAPASAAPAAKAPPKPRKPSAASRTRASKAAFTLRLDPERHLRLRLACAVGNRSAQQIVTAALDAFLEGQPELEALAKQVPQGAQVKTR